MSEENLQYVILIGITLGVSIILSLVLRKVLSVFISRFAVKLKTDPTNFLFLKNSVSFLVYTTAIIYIFYSVPYLKSIGTALFAGAGILAVVVGFASQKAFSNIISGVFILIFKPFRVMDIIEFVDGKKGVVEEITLRHTIIKDYENRRIIIPNSIISDQTIINSNIQDEKIMKHIIFSISYDSNIDKAIDIIRDEALKHPLTLDNRSAEDIKKEVPKVVIRVIELGSYSVDLKAYVWTLNNDDGFILKCDLLKSVKERFDREGIEIPFPYRTLVYKKDIMHEEETI